MKYITFALIIVSLAIGFSCGNPKASKKNNAGSIAKAEALLKEKGAESVTSVSSDLVGTYIAQSSYTDDYSNVVDANNYFSEIKIFVNGDVSLVHNGPRYSEVFAGKLGKDSSGNYVIAVSDRIGQTLKIIKNQSTLIVINTTAGNEDSTPEYYTK